MDKRNNCLRLLLVAAVVVQCLANQPDLPESVSKDDLRSNLTNLVTANPNYFGNSPESNQSPVFPLSYDTTFEQLTSVGFNPVLNVLEATIEIKLPYGFGGDLCTNGSLEYVRFYVSYDEGWKDLEQLVTVNTHDIPDAFDCNQKLDKPLFYVLTLPFQPIRRECGEPLLPEIRAILSWNQKPPPDSPNWPPVFGNTVDQHIQSPALLPVTLHSALCIPSEDTVRNKRSDSQELLDYHQSPIDEQHILSEDSPTSGFSSRPGIPSNIWYEELVGLGLDYDLSRLVATVRIKQPVGYSNGLCQAGSFEYVDFWADWNNNCNWTYLGQLSINVHNIFDIPPDGLTYSVALPVDLRSLSRSCNTTKISPVRAALSWNSPPPTPPKVAARGNLLETHVQIQPYTTPPDLTQPVIFTIGSVILQNIDITGNGQTLPDATFVGFWDSDGKPQHTDPDWPNEKRQCPFGGNIYIAGPAIGQPSTSDAQPSQYQYRVVYRLVGSSSSGLPVLNSISVGDITFPPSFSRTWTPNSQGYLDYLSPERNVQHLLARWIPPDRELYQIRLEIAVQTCAGPPPVYETKGFTEWYNIQVNDRADPVGPTGIINFTNEPVCGTFPVGTLLEGTFTAVSPYFYQYSIWIINSGIPVVVANGLLPSTGPTEIFAPGVSWSWNSSQATPCGYVIELTVWDLTIYDSNADERYHVSVNHGFCVSAKIT